ncbi:MULTISPECIES: TolC family protein [Acinetobacter]|uniref:TolC family protein n=1 Tax=Acinetobacter TaxID=469 RepID=UPI00100FA0AC|nr:MULTISPECIES: TolC family protein [Acinetobacter]MCY0273959.1 TolC family protein [Acinetobacter baumannii]RXS91723.1 TolC family protein [Acinetobacter junii]
MKREIETQPHFLGKATRLLCLGCCMIITSVVSAKSELDQILPPLDAIKHSLSQHPTVRSAISDQDYANFSGQGLKLGQPWTVRAGMQLRNSNVQDSQTKSNNYEPNFGVEKQIRLPGKYQLDQDLAQRGMTIAELKYEDAKHEVAKTLLNQWFAYMRSALQLTRIEEQQERIQQYMQMTQQRIRAGDASRLELMLLSNEFRQIEEQYMQAKTAYYQAQQLLSRDYQGKIPEHWSSDIIKIHPLEYTQTEWIQQVLSANHELELAKTQAAQQDALVKREQLNRIPNPTVGVGYSREQSGVENLMSVSVSIPLASRQVRIASGMAMAEAQKANFEIGRVENRLRQETQYWFTQMESASVRSEQAQQNVAQLQQQHALMQKAYKLGELSLNELLLHSQQLVDARGRIDQAKIDYAESLSLLLLNSHQLWPLHEDHQAE